MQYSQLKVGYELFLMHFSQHVQPDKMHKSRAARMKFPENEWAECDVIHVLLYHGDGEIIEITYTQWPMGKITIQMQLFSPPLCLLIYQLVLSLHQLWILAPSLDNNGDDDSVCRHHRDIFACTTTGEGGGKWTLDELWWGHASTSDHEKWSLQQRNNSGHCTSSLIQILFTPICS